jgi:hypothetical protein
MEDLAAFFNVPRSLFDCSDQGLIEQIHRSMRFLEAQYDSPSASLERQTAVVKAYRKLKHQLETLNSRQEIQ